MQGEEAQPHKNITRSRFKLRCTECARRRIGCDKEIPCKPCLDKGLEAKCYREPLRHKDTLRELKKENQKWKEENKELRGKLLQLEREKALLLGVAVCDSPSIPNGFIASSQAVPPAGNGKDFDKEFRNLQEQLKELQGKFATLESTKADISGAAPWFEEVEKSVSKEERDNRCGNGDGSQLGRANNHSRSDPEHQAVVTCSSNSAEIGSRYLLQDMNLQHMSEHVPFDSLSVSALMQDVNYTSNTSLQHGGGGDTKCVNKEARPPQNLIQMSPSMAPCPEANYVKFYAPTSDTEAYPLQIPIQSYQAVVACPEPNVNYAKFYAPSASKEAYSAQIPLQLYQHVVPCTEPNINYTKFYTPPSVTEEILPFQAIVPCAEPNINYTKFYASTSGTEETPRPPFQAFVPPPSPVSTSPHPSQRLLNHRI